jgi:hypothetical protein
MSAGSIVDVLKSTLKVKSNYNCGGIEAKKDGVASIIRIMQSNIASSFTLVSFDASSFYVIDTEFWGETSPRWVNDPAMFFCKDSTLLSESNPTYFHLLNLDCHINSP